MADITRHDLDDLQVQVDALKTENEGLLEALKDAAERLETCARLNGNSPEAIEAMMGKFKRAIAEAEGRES